MHFKTPRPTDISPHLINIDCLRLITFGGRSAHLAYLVHKSGRKTSIIIIFKYHSGRSVLKIWGDLYCGPIGGMGQFLLQANGLVPLNYRPYKHSNKFLLNYCNCYLFLSFGNLKTQMAPVFLYYVRNLWPHNALLLLHDDDQTMQAILPHGGASPVLLLNRAQCAG